MGKYTALASAPSASRMVTSSTRTSPRPPVPLVPLAQKRGHREDVLRRRHGGAARERHRDQVLQCVRHARVAHGVLDERDDARGLAARPGVRCSRVDTAERRFVYPHQNVELEQRQFHALVHREWHGMDVAEHLVFPGRARGGADHLQRARVLVRRRARGVPPSRSRARFSSAPHTTPTPGVCGRTTGDASFTGMSTSAPALRERFMATARDARAPPIDARVTKDGDCWHTLLTRPDRF